MRKLTAKTLTLVLILAPSLLFAQSSVPSYLSQEVSSEAYSTKKIAEGYYPEIFTRINLIMQNRVEGRKNAEKIVAQSYSTSPLVADVLKINKAEQNYNVDSAIRDVLKANKQSENIASATGEFTYIPNSDGKITYFIDGLPSTILHERVVDEYGKTSLKDTLHMTYNDRRLLTGYQATVTDILGNKNSITASGMTYSADSVSYGTAFTNANKNILAYTIREVDDLGNTKTTQWDAANYEGKLLRSFTQTLDDSIYGKSNFTRSNIQYSDAAHMISYHENGVGTDELAYESDRTAITYTAKDQWAGYHDITINTLVDGTKSKTVTDAEFTYLDTPNFFAKDVEGDPNRLLMTHIKSSTTNPDGSMRTDTSVTNYSYNDNFKIVGASGKDTFDGRSAKWFEYTDAAGHTLSYNKDTDGKITYSYIDSTSHNVVYVDAANVINTLKDGSRYNGATDIKYEILAESPMVKSQHSVINTFGTDDKTAVSIEDSTVTNTNGLVKNRYRLLSQNESTQTSQPVLDPSGVYASTKNIDTTYTYDAKANLSAVKGAGSSKGWEYSDVAGWNSPFAGKIDVTYQITKGKALVKDYTETRTIADKAPSTTPDFSKYTDSASLMTKAWEYYTNSDYGAAKLFAQETIDRYAATAASQQSALTDFAPAGSESENWALNDVATAYYILGKSYEAEKDNTSAKAQFNKIINNYGFAQCWDTHGWYWKVADGAKTALQEMA